MEQPSRKLSWLVWGGLWLTVALIVVAFVLAKFQDQRRARQLPAYGEVGSFTLTNQLARAVTLDDLRGRVWVADIIFTRCPGPCAKMTRQMAELQAGLPAGTPAKLVSLTTDPDFDQPDILKRYGERFGANHDRWWFLTGTKPQLKQLAMDGLKLTAIEKQPGERTAENDLFIHSTIFVVVDKRGQLRAIFETQPSDLDENGQPLSGIDPKRQWEEARAKILATVNLLAAEH